MSNMALPPSLPEPVAAYFAGNAQLDAAAMLAPFAPDAEVSDERQTHRGTAAIAAWIKDASLAASAIATPLDHRHQDGIDVVTGAVAGNFPGSPITLTFRFRLAGDRIAALHIG